MVFWINMLPELTSGATIWTRSQGLTFHLAYSYPKKKGVAGGGGGKKTDLFHKSTNERSLHVAVHLDCTVLRSTIKTSQLPIEYFSFWEYYLLCSPTRFYSWDTCRNLQRNQSQWTWTSSQWWLLVWFGSTRQDNSSSLQYGNRRSVT